MVLSATNTVIALIMTIIMHFHLRGKRITDIGTGIGEPLNSKDDIKAEGMMYAGRVAFDANDNSTSIWEITLWQKGYVKNTNKTEKNVRVSIVS